MDYAQWEYREEDLARNKAQAAYCQECAECEAKCPQKLPIMAQLKETDQALGKRAGADG
jgi:predicted aldo/keto reductase-like oxidoreductase